MSFSIQIEYYMRDCNCNPDCCNHEEKCHYKPVIRLPEHAPIKQADKLFYEVVNYNIYSCWVKLFYLDKVQLRAYWKTKSHYVSR